MFRNLFFFKNYLFLRNVMILRALNTAYAAVCFIGTVAAYATTMLEVSDSIPGLDQTFLRSANVCFRV